MGSLNIDNNIIQETNRDYNNWLKNKKLVQRFYSKLNPEQLEFIKLFETICENADDEDKAVAISAYQLYILHHYKTPKTVLSATIDDIKQELNIDDVTAFEITKYVLIKEKNNKFGFWEAFPMMLAQRNSKLLLYPQFVLTLTAALMNIGNIVHDYNVIIGSVFIVSTILRITLAAFFMWHSINLGKAIYLKIKYNL